jgi:two-component system chemotaxis response regulator CheY
MKILIVDDSRAMRMVLLRNLRQAGFSDHAIIEATTGVEALEIIRTEAPDLVLSDWNMPDLSGIDLLRTLRQEGSLVKFGFITSETSDEPRQQAIALGAAVYITKPFTVETLQSTLAPYLG